MPSDSTSTTPQSERVVRWLLSTSGLRAALGHLNARTRHRYTGVYHFDAPWLRSLELYDREFPLLRTRSETPLSETYCSVMRGTGRSFSTSDAAHDSRLAGHVARDQVAAYAGVPLFDSRGTCFGSLCHFDPRPRVLLPSELALLESVAGDVATAALELFFTASDAVARSSLSS